MCALTYVKTRAIRATFQDRPREEAAVLRSGSCRCLRFPPKHVGGCSTLCRPPFNAPNLQQLHAKIVNGKVSRLPSCFSDDINSLVQRLLEIDVSLFPELGF